jgi:hypothetical protein
LQENAQDDDKLTTYLLDKPPKEELRNDAAESLGSVEDPKLSSSRVAEVGLPVRKCSHSIHDAAIKTVRCLNNDHNTKPCVQFSKMFVFVPGAIEELLHIDSYVSALSASNNLVLLCCHIDSTMNFALEDR